MIQIEDPTLASILTQGGAPNISSVLASAAYWKACLLLAARSWSTIGGFTGVARLPGGRFAAPIDATWVISFAWDYDLNRAFALQLERLPDEDFDEGELPLA